MLFHELSLLNQLSYTTYFSFMSMCVLCTIIIVRDNIRDAKILSVNQLTRVHGLNVRNKKFLLRKLSSIFFDFFHIFF